MKRVLFISGSLGLGHVSRDLAIARELRRSRSDLEICWLAADPARSVIQEAGESLVGESDLYRNDTVQAEGSARGNRLDLLAYAFRALTSWLRNADLVKKITDKSHYDLIVGDETYEIPVATIVGRLKLRTPFVMIYDFLGMDSMSRNPLEAVGAFLWNRIWSLDHRVFDRKDNLALFIGEPEDIPDKRFGLLLPNRREYARRNYHFVGYILGFDPDDLADRAALRTRLGYGAGPLVVCSIGGTSIGKNLLELCGRAYVIAERQVEGLQMVLVCGPRLQKEVLDVPPGAEVRQYVPKLYEHFAACDLGIVQAGGASTLELATLKRPFLYFPIEGHSEQELTVAGRLERYQAGQRMSYSSSDDKSLAEAIVANIGKRVTYRKIPTNGASNAVQFINKLV
jgi:UDP:flavonoid glycosyltransferase YjiC (YdhE family)